MSPDLPEIDTANHFLASGHGDRVTLLRPPRPGQQLTRDEALALAAWLVAMADPGRQRFEQVYRAVLNT